MKKIKLGDIGSVRMCKRILKEETNSEGGIPFYKISTFGNVADVFIDKDKYENYKTRFSYPKKGEVLISAAGTIGRTVIYNGEDAYFQDSNIVWIENEEKEVLNSFLYYAYQNVRWKTSNGSTILRLYNDDLRNTEILIPEDISEQKRIAKVLSNIDRKISINREINRNLEELAKQIYDYWFVQFDFPNEDGKPYKSSGGKMVWNETLKRNIPEGWEVKKVDELAEIQKKQITPKENIEYKHYSLPNFDKYESYSIENGNTIFSDKFFVESGNLLISKLNPWTDRTVWVDDVNNAICSTEYVVLKQNDKCIQSYLNQIAHTQSFIDYCTSCSTGTSHSHRRVKPELMTGYKVPFQENIVKAFGKQIYPIIKKKLNIQNENRNLIIFRDELLPLLMNGQVTLNSCLSAD